MKEKTRDLQAFSAFVKSLWNWYIDYIVKKTPNRITGANNNTSERITVMSNSRKDHTRTHARSHTTVTIKSQKSNSQNIFEHRASTTNAEFINKFMPYLQNLRACASAFMVFVRKFTAKISISEDTMIHTRTHRLYGASRMTRLKQLLYSEQKSSSKKKRRDPKQ